MLEKLSAFVKQRPGLEFANYGDVSIYRSEMRRISKYKLPCLFLIEKVMDSPITA